MRPYLSRCIRRQWQDAGWVCGLDDLDCDPAEPAPCTACPRFIPARAVCPVCLSLGRASRLLVDDQTAWGGSAEAHWACPACCWHGGPAELLDGLEWACLDLLEDVRFWRSRPGLLSHALSVVQGEAAHGR